MRLKCYLSVGVGKYHREVQIISVAIGSLCCLKPLALVILSHFKISFCDVFSSLYGNFLGRCNSKLDLCYRGAILRARNSSVTFLPQGMKFIHMHGGRCISLVLRDKSHLNCKENVIDGMLNSSFYLYLASFLFSGLF